MKAHYALQSGEKSVEVEFERDDSGIRLRVGEERAELQVTQVAPGEYLVSAGNQVYDLLISGAHGQLMISRRDGDCRVLLLDEHQVAMAERAGYGAHRTDGVIAVCAPMPGKVVKVLVSEGDAVEEGQGVIVVEAMKMENELRCPVDGTIRAILVEQGESVEAGQQLVIVE